MRNLTAVLIALIMVLSIASCGGSSGNGVVTSDVELLDFAEERICCLFAPEGFEFHENSAEGGYNSGRNHIMVTPDEEYEIDAGLIAAYDSILYDLFLNGEMTGTYYSGMEIDPEEVYELPVKEELDFEVAGNKVYYIERVINGGYSTGYVVFEHIDKNGDAGLYGVDLWSNDEEFYTKENSIKVFKEVYGIGRTKSAVYFGNSYDEEEDTYGTLESAYMIYGSDEIPLIIYKPENGTIELAEEDLENNLDLIWISSDDFEWNIDVFGAISFDSDVPSHGFVDYYYKGSLDPEDSDYAYFDADIYELDIKYDGQPVKVIRYTYAESGYEEYEETEYFVGVEFVDTYNGEYCGDGLLGFRYYMFDEDPTDDELAKLFSEVFGDGNHASRIEVEDDEDFWNDDTWYDDEGIDTDLIVGEWMAVDEARDEVFCFYDGDYATYTLYGEEYDITYSLSDDAYLYIEVEGGGGIGYTVTFDGSDTMILVDDYGNEVEFERI